MVLKRTNNLVSPLQHEIIECKILPRLPVKSLSRFKSVCKSWNSLISSNYYFIKSQLDLNPHKDSLILYGSDYNSNYDPFISKYSTLIGSINGLVCVCRWYHYSDVIEIAIWNPATNQCSVIPRPPRKEGARMHNSLLGFGFDSVANDFKVMHGTLIEKQPLAVSVYSCKSACWKNIAPSNILYRGDIGNRREPAIVNGSPFWLNTKNQNAKISLVVFSFDVQLEVFSLLPSFGVEYFKYRSCNLMNFRDSIAITVYDQGTYFVKPIDVYIFNQRSSDWNKISVGPYICKEPDIKLNLIPCFRKGDVLFVNSDSCRLFGINPETHTIKILNEGSSKEPIFNCFNYSESLSFVDGTKPVYGKRDGGRFKFLHREELELARSYEFTDFLLCTHTTILGGTI